jgi:hypothetical protein
MKGSGNGSAAPPAKPMGETSRAFGTTWQRRLGLVSAALMACGWSAAPDLAAAAEDEPLDPAVARCILENLPRAQSRGSADLIRLACEGLIHGNGDPGGGYLVECRVPNDPSWIEFRLVTREQCEQANGRAVER